MQYGRDVLADGHLHHQTTYSFTADGHRWINHELLSELLLAATVDNFGNQGLMIGKFLISLIVFGALYRCARAKQLSSIYTAGLLWLAAWNLSYFWSFRPQVLSFFFFTLLLWILEFAFQGWHGYLSDGASSSQQYEDEPEFSTKRLHILWLVPVVLCLWTNSHGGFVAGSAVYLAYLGCRGLEALHHKRSKAIGLIVRMAVMGLIGVAGTLLNPYGIELHQWLVASLGVPRPEIIEWHPTELFSLVGMRYLLLMALAAIVLTKSKRPRDFTQIIIMALLCWQSYKHVRHIPFFAIACAFWLPTPIRSCSQQLNAWIGDWWAEEQPTQEKNVIAYSVQLAMLACALIGCGSRLSEIHVVKSWFPVSAFQYMSDHDLSGRAVFDFDWAQYAIGCFGTPSAQPHCEVAIDGRFRTCYSQEVIDMHFDFVLGDGGPDRRFRGNDSPPFDPTRVLSYKNPELVVNRRNADASVKTMEACQDKWALLYQDEIAQVWGIRDKYDNPNSPHFIPTSDRNISDAPQIGSKPWPALPDRLTDPNTQEPTRLVHQPG